MPRPANAQGMTLIEVLVALAIMAVSLMAGLQASAALTRLANRQSQQWQAQLCADNALTAIRLQKLMPALGDSASTCRQGVTDYQVVLQVRPTPNPSFRRVQARVEVPGPDAQPVVLLDLSTVVGRY